MKLIKFCQKAVLSLLDKKTVGVRALIINDNQVLLVKHTYQPMWYTIGGGVEKAETPLEGMLSEAKEEVGAVEFQPELFSVYYANSEKRDDYIIFYIIKDARFIDMHSSEIAEKKWFSLDLLPEDISPATKRRIDEYLGVREISDRW